MASTIRQRLRRFNGTDYDTIHLETETGVITDYPYPSNPNLLDNWYFVGGGSQQEGEQFPINQRNGYIIPPGVRYRLVSNYSIAGDTTQYYTVAFIDNTTNPHFYIDGVEYYVDHNEVSSAFVPGYIGAVYGIDRWIFSPDSGNGALSIQEDAIRITQGTTPNPATSISQSINPHIVTGKTVTASMLVKTNVGYSQLLFVVNGTITGHAYKDANSGYTLISSTITLPNTLSDLTLFFYGSTTTGSGNYGDIKAVKLEIGDKQTLAHQDASSNWVLNEVPNYQEQLFRCLTSKVDIRDTYANKTNIVDNYYVRPNLLDNWYFVGGGSQQDGRQFPINQRNGMIAPATAPYYTDATFSTQVGLLENPVEVVSYGGTWAEIKLEGVSYYCYLPHCIPGYSSNAHNVYGIDRWKINIAGSMALERDGLLISNLGTRYGGIWQESERFSLTKATKYTFSVLLSNPGTGWYIDVHLVNATTNTTIIGATTQGRDATDGVVSVTFDAPPVTDSLVFLRIFVCNFRVSTNSTCKIIAAKLELGDTQTLARQENGTWVLNEVPNFQQELAKCQRHQVLIPFRIGDALSTVVSDGNANCSFPIYLPTTPRVTRGTFLLKSGQLRVHGKDMDYSAVTAETTVRVQGNIVSLYCLNLTRLELYTLDSATGGEFLLDFNLY